MLSCLLRADRCLTAGGGRITSPCGSGFCFCLELALWLDCLFNGWLSMGGVSVSNDAGFTKGPWRVDASNGAIHIRPGISGFIVAFISPDWMLYGDRPDENPEANARLIAAAPDLYEACKAFIRAAEEGVIVSASGDFIESRGAHAVVSDARRALAKANGSTQAEAVEGGARE